MCLLVQALVHKPSHIFPTSIAISSPISWRVFVESEVALPEKGMESGGFRHGTLLVKIEIARFALETWPEPHFFASVALVGFFGRFKNQNVWVAQMRNLLILHNSLFLLRGLRQKDSFLFFSFFVLINILQITG
jgi:hypothetical protein